MQKIEGDEKPVVEHQPVLFMTDLQHLLLYAIQGNTASFKPRLDIFKFALIYAV